MERQVWKYSLAVETRQDVMMPKGARVLTVQVQQGQPCVWALVDPHTDPDDYWPVTLCTYGTGHPMPGDPGEYVGTFQLSGGALVFHVFAHQRAESAGVS